ncbi:uncharacterized protein LOC112689107 [Sipha flava]|uniref:Uncharacterized protein LOC112689107 n=1 Tax=Sipha flava TaxID=143950 RepID=A0A8B8G6R5_9HEMI|nr:uncharacterized protein LOC112689107 [Sipha flava]
MNFVSFQVLRCVFLKKRETRFNKNKTLAMSVYYCHHSRIFSSKAIGKRIMKIIGSCKMGNLDKFCPSYIQVVVKKCGNVEIKYYKTHRGHYNKVKYLPFLRKSKK